ncbi:MAG TPA: DUF255 domain-containing protein, partial [Gammaproteobacteria bacterium]|nr:DUF255 domain-containing protein [Gammaproteobacteria bacterium]
MGLGSISPGIASPGIDSPTVAELAFIKQHWGQETILLQGQAPAHYSPLEASLLPQSCGQCHPQQYQDWKASLHSRAMGPGVLGQLMVMQENDPATARACWSCHTPLAEQQGVLKKNSNQFQKNIHFNQQLQHEGLVCAACHVRQHQRFGPPSKTGSTGNEADLPHNGFSPQSAFGKSVFCKKCHQFGEEGYSLNGKLLENTYMEWRQSQYAQKGVQCQNCHMPGRRHLWRGIHDRNMLKNALRISIGEQTKKLSVGDELKVSLKFENIGAGHHLPTYLTPRILVRGVMLDDAEQIIEGSLLEASIGREVPLDLSHEVHDTRIPANDFVTIDYQHPIDEYSYRLKIEVFVQPDYFYEKFYRSMLDSRSAGKGRSLIQQALKNAASSEYRLFEKTVLINRVAAKSAVTKNPFSMSNTTTDNPQTPLDWSDNRIPWYGYEQGLQKAREENKPVLLIFYADWCPTCHAYQQIFIRSDIQNASNNLIMVRVNVDEFPQISAAYADVGSYVPRTFLLDAQGNRKSISRYVSHK